MGPSSGHKDDGPVTVDASTRINFFTMIGATASLLGVAIIGTAKLVSIDNRLDNIEKKVADPWTMEKQRDYMRIFEAENRGIIGLRVPEVK